MWSSPPTQTNTQPPSITEIDGAVGLCGRCETGLNTKQGCKNAAYCPRESRSRRQCEPSFGLCQLCLRFLQLKEVKGLHSAGHCHRVHVFLSLSLSRMIDSPLLQRYVTRHTVWFLSLFWCLTFLSVFRLQFSK